MKKNIEIAPTVSDLAEDKDYARELRTSAILPLLEGGGEIVLDFHRVKYVT